MNNGKRSINISLGSGSANLNARPNPFSRPTRPSTTTALGFGDDDENDDENGNDNTPGPPKRKQIKLDHGQADTEDQEDDAFLKLSAPKTSAPRPPPAVFRDDDDDEEDAFSRLVSRKDPEETPATLADEEQEEDDPLDAFMAGIDTQVKKEAEMPSEEKVRRDDIEDEDYVESYMKHMKKKGIMVGQGGPVQERNEDVDSDEEVYATARAIDNSSEQQFDPDEMGYDLQSNGKKEITPLPRVDHSRQNYVEIEKCFYEEHEDIARLTDEQVKQIRLDLDMRVSGADAAKPCISFAHFGFEEALMETIRRAGYSEPSGIQQQAIPVALSGRDIIGIAKTGSGKTAAFLLPMIVHIMDQEELEKGDGPIGIVLAPTRELADQIYSEAKRFAKAYSLRVAVVYGGASKQDQFKTLRSGVEIVVATPGRLIDMIKIKATNFKRTSFLVMDEADRFFDLGFEPQVRSICDNIRPDRQTVLFSATFQKRVEKLAREVMTDPVRISIGNVGQINSDVTQVIQILKDDTLKWKWLMDRLQELEALGSVLIFVSRKNGVVELTENLKNMGVRCECLHGDMVQQERDKAVHDYKNRLFPTLIATDVAARGLDIKSIRTVINYDVARDIDSHVHRVGRTGRAGEKGTAFTLITDKDDRFAGELVRNLEEGGQSVSPDVMKIAMQNPRFRKSRQFMGSQRGGHRGRGGRGRGAGGGGGGGGRGGNRGGRGGGYGGRFHSSDGSGEQGHSTASNNTPLGQGSRGDRWDQGGGNSGHQPDRSGRNFDNHRVQGSGYRVSGFQKASRPETGGSIPPTHEQTPVQQAPMPTPPLIPLSAGPDPRPKQSTVPADARPPPPHQPSDARPPAPYFPPQSLHNQGQPPHPLPGQNQGYPHFHQPPFPPPPQARPSGPPGPSPMGYPHQGQLPPPTFPPGARPFPPHAGTFNPHHRPPPHLYRPPPPPGGFPPPPRPPPGYHALAFAAERAVAIHAVLSASKVCQRVFTKLVNGETITKKDKSPVTIGDFSAQAVINTILHKSFPEDPIVGEEDSKDLRGEEGRSMREKVLELANSGLDQALTEDLLLETIDRGTFAGGAKGRMWALDPIDGTKGFLRGEQFAVCLALIVDGQVQVGVMGCPNLPVDAKDKDGEKGCLFITVKGQGAFQRNFSSSTETPISMSSIQSLADASFCESVESGHSNQSDSARIAHLLGITKPPVRMDSQCKYCSLSRGDAEVYLRLPVSATYEEKIWDHASGSLLVSEAGGIVSDIHGQPLDFSKGRTLATNSGVIAAHAKIHGRVIEAVQKVLFPEGKL
ncbi:ATP-dependent RNA helicase ddx42 [Linnemannia exigua]|uniref:ATP-dependent RNA helicase ddx42 n=1 Tax=Linnemannia exigua TaxID=604196 RepID=A0AAD4DKX4_9FUNG|nr:ATP-dependent RNA helicase ddx42 [Linnemannia exigua]